MTSKLLMLREPALASRLRFVLDKEETIVGRSSRCDLVVMDKSVSRKHATLQLRDDGLLVCDLGSRNGTFVNGERINSGLVSTGVQLQFGKIGFVVVAAEDEATDARSDWDTEKAREAIRNTESPHPECALSAAQRRVLAKLVQGDSEKEIAKALILSRHTIHNHIRAIYRAFDVHSRPELLACYIGNETNPTGIVRTRS